MNDGMTRPKKSIVFDVSDLMSYFVHSRLPTGIQRFQIKLSTRWLPQPYDDAEITIACYEWRTGFWVPIPPEPYAEVIGLAVVGGDVDDPEWRHALTELRRAIDAAKPLAFKPGAILFNPSPAFWIRDYYVALRVAKAKSAVIYLPYIHDCIPVVVPELCDHGIPVAFTNILAGLFYHSRHFQANSQASARDLVSVAAQLGHAISEPEVVLQDARYSDRVVLPRYRRNARATYGLGDEPFVLFVATIEPRKNHFLAFRAWLSMVRKRGSVRTPRLVCVGKRGWRSEAALAFLDASEVLREKVLLISRASDDDVDEFYRNCLFTIFPSIYEGWGLPITEAFSYGKVPLTTRTSSLGEAGGELAEYFDHLSVRDMVGKLERLIDDKTYREARQAAIKQSFHPRSWDDVADEIVEKALVQTATGIPRSRNGRAAGPAAADALPAELGRYYALALLPALDLWPGMVAGEMYRSGAGWWTPENWGTWMRYGRAELSLSLPADEEGSYLLYLGLKAPPWGDADYQIRVRGGESREEGRLSDGESRWAIVMIEREALHCGAVRVELATTRRCYLGERTGDSRTVGLGVLGFFICREDDLLTRHCFIEALRLDRLHGLSGRPLEADLVAH